MAHVRLEPMTEERFTPYRAYTEEFFARSLAEAGTPPEEAAAEAARSTARLLPDGLSTPDHHLWVAWDGETEVGVLWVQIKADRAFGFDFLVHEHLRRQGYGQAMMVAAEQRCRELGALEIGLHVFAHNAGARELYERMGFETRSYNMGKSLS
jgi:GNAT superfamily N-acetyltransferase